jgi:hypothetical protein
MTSRTPMGVPRERRGLLGRAGSSEGHHGRRVDAEGLSGLCVGEPRELHERAACCVQDQPLDLSDIAIDAVALAAVEGDLRDRAHDAKGAGCGRVDSRRWSRAGRSPAPRVSIISLRLLASARCASVSCSRVSAATEATPCRRVAQCPRSRSRKA